MALIVRVRLAAVLLPAGLSGAHMITINHILCPVDFSAFSNHALQHALQLARWFDSTLTVLYVYPPPAAPPSVVFGGLPGPLLLEPYAALTVSPELVHEDALAQLTKFAATVDTRGVELHVTARSGTAVRGILAESAASHSDLIVLGTHGHGGFDRWMLGSVTEKILRKASCPVLTIPPPVSESAGGVLQMFKRILCPVDFSDSSLKALEYAMTLAKEAAADLLLMHVIEGVADVRHWQQPLNPSILEYLRLSEQNTLQRLHALIPTDARAWCRPHEMLVAGKPYEEILRVARDEDAHLIVMGVHGRNPIDLMFFGSTTNHVVRGAACPVLTLKA
jgi:nucleotide-binding universal stress UspA family protein